jgi:hypothetical protein
VAGYPIVTVPMGFIYELPVGMSFMGTAWSEPTLIRLAAGFEAANPVRRVPQYFRSFPKIVRIPIFKDRQHTIQGVNNRNELESKLAQYLKPRIRRPMFL